MNNEKVYFPAGEKTVVVEGDSSKLEMVRSLAEALGKAMSDEPLPDTPDRRTFEDPDELIKALEGEVRELNRAQRRLKAKEARRKS